MGLISRSIPNLFNGVSQQPPALRSTSQCELMDNGYPHVATGVGKRPPTEYLSKLSASSFTSAFLHTLSRDSSERYEVVITNGDLKVFDLITGLEKTVNFPDGKGYLTATDPKRNFAAVTVADYTFIVNKTKVVAQGSTTAARVTNVAYFFLRDVVAYSTFTLTVDGASFSQSAGSGGNYDTNIDSAVTGLATTLGANYTVTKFGKTCIKVVKIVGDITSTAIEGRNDSIKDLTQGVQRFADLPPAFANSSGFVVKIIGEPTSSYDDYYVKYDETSGGWVETVKDAQKNTLDSTTLPHKLVRNTDGTFTFSKATWNDRKVGDDNSIPVPSFVGRTIADIFFYRNRLGLVTDENIVLSRSGEYYNYWGETVTAVLDSDPIDVAVSHVKVSILRHAIPFNKTLLVFSDQTQFQLSSGEVLSPKTVKLEAVTEFESSAYARPVGAGQDVFFAVEKSGNSGIREYFVDESSAANDAADITAHISQYLPKNITKLTASSAEDVLMALSSDTPNVVYVYKYYWGKEEKLQSAWGRFVLPEGSTVLNIDILNSVLYILVQRSDGLFLEKMDLQLGRKETGLEYLVHLDRKASITGTNSAGTGKTTWTLPYASAEDIQGVLSSAFGTAAGTLLNLTKTSATTVEATGDYTAGTVMFGNPYTFRYRFSEQFLRDSNNVSIPEGRLQLRKFSVLFDATGYFRAEVTPEARDLSTYLFTGKILGTLSTILGKVGITAGRFDFPVMSNSRGVTVDLVNDSFLPSFFQTAEWVGTYSSKVQRKL